MAVYFQLGIQQFAVDRELKPAAFRRHQGNRIDFRLEFLKELGYQTGSSIGVVSDCTVHQVDFHQHFYPPSFERTPPPTLGRGLKR